jgi:hypothetical protein
MRDFLPFRLGKQFEVLQSEGLLAFAVLALKSKSVGLAEECLMLWLFKDQFADNFAIIWTAGRPLRWRNDLSIQRGLPSPSRIPYCITPRPC